MCIRACTSRLELTFGSAASSKPAQKQRQKAFEAGCSGPRCFVPCDDWFQGVVPGITKKPCWFAYSACHHPFMPSPRPQLNSSLAHTCPNRWIPLHRSRYSAGIRMTSFLSPWLSSAQPVGLKPQSCRVQCVRHDLSDVLDWVEFIEFVLRVATFLWLLCDRKCHLRSGLVKKFPFSCWVQMRVQEISHQTAIHLRSSSISQVMYWLCSRARTSQMLNLTSTWP